MLKRNLLTAAQLLASLTNRPHIKDDELGIIRIGADNRIPIYWFNDLRTSTYISDFTGDLRATYENGPRQLTHTSLSELAGTDSLAVFEFQFTEQDFTLLAKIKGKAVDDDGNLLGYRHPATKDGTVTVTRDQLFVYEHDLMAYAATMTSVKESAEVPPPPDAQAPATESLAVEISALATTMASEQAQGNAPLVDTVVGDGNGHAPAPLINAPVDRGWVMKKAALIEKHERQWSTIKRDFQDASENGLSKSAKAPGHGDWFEADALNWARQRGKLKEVANQPAPIQATTLSGLMHRMAG